MANQLQRILNRQERKEQEELAKEIDEFRLEINKVQAKYGFRFRPIIEPFGPMLIVEKIPENELVLLKEELNNKEKTYVTTVEQNIDTETSRLQQGQK